VASSFAFIFIFHKNMLITSEEEMTGLLSANTRQVHPCRLGCRSCGSRFATSSPVIPSLLQ